MREKVTMRTYLEKRSVSLGSRVKNEMLPNLDL